MPKPSVGASLPQGDLALSHLRVPSLFPMGHPFAACLVPKSPRSVGWFPPDARGAGGELQRGSLDWSRALSWLWMLPSLLPEMALLGEDSNRMGLGSASGLWGVVLREIALA